jgi:hypothetical protein
MKNLLAILLIGILLQACQKEVGQNEIISNDRLSFISFRDFNKSYLELSKLTSKEDLLIWANSKNHSTLLNTEDSALNEYPFALLAMFNKDSEIEINDSIVWLNNGILYAFSKNDEMNLMKLKNKLEKCKIMGSFKVSVINNKLLKTVSLGINNSIDARNQKAFVQQYYQPCGGIRQSVNGDRKYVHELYTIQYTDPLGYSTTELYLRIKLEYKGSKYWKPAGENRTININVSGIALYSQGATNISSPYSVVKNYTCSGDRDELLCYQAVNGSGASWQVSMSGTIYQIVNGDVTTNGWYNSGTLW